VTLPLSVVPGSLGQVLYGQVAASSVPTDDPSEADHEGSMLRHTTLLVIALAVALALVLVLLVPIVFGTRFRAATIPGLILLPGTAGLAFFNVLGGAVSGRAKPELVLWTTMLTTAPTVGMYFVLIPALGIDGAALGSTISYVSSAVLLGLLLRRTDGRAILPRLLPGRGELAYYRLLSQRLRAMVR
jgi:O-antigen/teichoic acid export membrane protein